MNKEITTLLIILGMFLVEAVLAYLFVWANTRQ